MNPSRVLLAALLRTVVLVGAMAAYLAVLARGESTDALGDGLLAFLILVVIGFGWALVDGVRRGLVAALLIWVLAAVVSGIGIPAVLALAETDKSVGAEILDGAVFFALLLFVPALLGLGLGAIGHRFRGGPQDAHSAPATASVR